MKRQSQYDIDIKLAVNMAMYRLHKANSEKCLNSARHEKAKAERHMLGARYHRRVVNRLARRIGMRGSDFLAASV